MATAVAPDAAAELAQALGQVSETVTVKVGGKPREVTVTPFRLRQFARVLKSVQRLRDAGLVEPDALKGIAEGDDAGEAAKRLDFLKMFLDGGEEIVNVLTVAVEGKMKAEHVDALDLADGARLASAVFAVNLDFFTRTGRRFRRRWLPRSRPSKGWWTRAWGLLGSRHRQTPGSRILPRRNSEFHARSNTSLLGVRVAPYARRRRHAPLPRQGRRVGQG